MHAAALAVHYMGQGLAVAEGLIALDLGGLHVPLDGSITIDSKTAGTFGLTDGDVSRISVFHAERKGHGSTFRLTLAGFYAAPSVCTPNCGDGVVEAGEQCDDGLNTGGYGKCGPGCKLGAYCGDGMVQPPEQCDDGQGIMGSGTTAALFGPHGSFVVPPAPAVLAPPVVAPPVVAPPVLAPLAPPVLAPLAPPVAAPPVLAPPVLAPPVLAPLTPLTPA